MSERRSSVSSPALLLCGSDKCKKPTKKIAQRDYQVKCWHCSASFHTSWVGFDDKDVAKIHDGGLLALCSFTCTNCKCNIGAMERRLSDLERRIADIERAGTPPPVTSLDLGSITQLVTATVREVMEVESKALGFVVIGAPESADAAADPRLIADVCSKVSVDPADVSESHRFGPPNSDGRPRIMKVRFRNKASRRKFLTGFHSVRAAIPGLENSRVRPDLTFQQRQQDRQLRTELQRRREAGERVKISRGQIVQVNN